MTRGYYTVLTPAVGSPLASVCPHRHYELGGALARCLRERGGEAVYVDDQGQRRPLRLDERRELQLVDVWAGSERGQPSRPGAGSVARRRGGQ